jgi:geranylgeranyl diphosphate synthase type I
MAGDLACTYMNEIIVGTSFTSEYRARAIQELSLILEREVFGETLDIVIELKDNPTREDVILVQQLKTAPYTFDSPMKLGAILAGASEQQIKALESFTLSLGTAFQIQDDILGMFGSEDKTGKPIISDLREGKITLLILDALEKATPEQEKTIRSSLGNEKVTIEDLESVKKVITETGALDKSNNFAIELANQSKKILEGLDLKEEGKEFLLGIADYMIKREY